MGKPYALEYEGGKVCIIIKQTKNCSKNYYMCEVWERNIWKGFFSITQKNLEDEIKNEDFRKKIMSEVSKYL